MNSRNILPFIAALFGLFASCSQQPAPTEEKQPLIQVTGEQFNTVGMELGLISRVAMEDVVKCNGVITPQPSGMSTVCVPVPGMIRTVFCTQGQYVRQGEAIFEVTGHELIDLQQEYAETSSLLKRQMSEYERIKSLYTEKVSSEKEFLLYEGMFKSTQAKFLGLKMKIESLGLSCSGIESGVFFPVYRVTTPISGQVSSISAHPGMYADPQMALAEVIDPGKLHLSLSVFSRDVEHLKAGQPVHFRIDSDSKYLTARLVSIGSAADPETRAIQCFATFTGESDFRPISNTFVNAEVVIRIDSVNSVPSEALLLSGKEKFLLEFVRKQGDDYFFRKRSVQTGRQREGRIEILGDPGSGQVLLRGVYHLSVQ